MEHSEYIFEYAKGIREEFSLKNLKKIIWRKNLKKKLKKKNWRKKEDKFQNTEFR